MNAKQSILKPSDSTPDGLCFRVYSFKELAALYFPFHRPEIASRKLSHLLHRDAELWEALCNVGFGARKRLVTPAQTQVLLCYLGSPTDFAEANQKA